MAAPGHCGQDVQYGFVVVRLAWQYRNLKARTQVTFLAKYSKQMVVKAARIQPMCAMVGLKKLIIE